MIEHQGRTGLPRLLCLIGSGEMSPAMVPLHAELMGRVASPPNPAAVLDTTYGFQENADELSRRAERYFSARVRHPIAIASLREVAGTETPALERTYKQLREACYIFAGPGSPSYAARQWRASLVPQLFDERLRDGGCLTLASAAAITIGRYAVPVYEIYKVGEPAHWIEGLDLLAPSGLELAIITHYDNREGGTHDTRYCYLGERRLRQLERQLPDSTIIFGIAEHTAVIFDLDADRFEVRGRGFAVARRRGQEQRFLPGKQIPVDELGAPKRVTPSPTLPARGREIEGSALPTSGREVKGKQQDRQRRFFDALSRDAFDEAADILVETDAALADEDQENHAEARSIFRSMLLELGQAAGRAAVGREPLARIAEITIRLRDAAREDRRYSEADRLRTALLDLGIEVQDTPVGGRWSLLDSTHD